MISSSCYGIWFCVIQLQCFVFRRLIEVFYLCVGNLDRQNIFDQKETTNQIIIVNMLKKLSHKYFSHHTIIKFVCFELIYYVINLGVVSSYMIFSEFVFLSIYYYFESIKKKKRG